jgi:cell wall-associated NlpC family hydrolase
VAPNVRFPREIRQGMSGEDVTGHKRALSRARPDLYEWTQFTDYAGTYFLDAVVKWKVSKGLGKGRVLGGRAHEVLERTRRKGHPDEWAFDARAVALCQTYYDRVSTTPEERARAAIVAAGFFWHTNRFAIRYSQYRPYQLRKPPGVPTQWDCSGFVTNCHYAGGAPDPNGRGYDGLGYTGTLIDHGRRVMTVGELEPGDLIFYGRTAYDRPGFPAGSPTHVAMYVGLDRGTHMILTLGSYPMKYVAFNYRTDVNQYRTYQVV